MKFEEWFDEIKRNQNITEISLFINDDCNLNCSFCYAKHIWSAVENNVDNIDWMKFLSEAIETDDIKTVSIVGKEPFITPEKTLDLLENLHNKFPQIKKGVVTNLQLMTPVVAEKLFKIFKESMDKFFVDVSLDGIPEFHNKLRGKDSWQKSLFGLFTFKVKERAQKFNIFVSHLLLPESIDDFSKFVSECNYYGLNNFVIFPYCDLKQNDKFSMQTEVYVKFIKQIMDGKNLPKFPNTFIVKNDYLNPEIMFASNKEFISFDKLQEDQNGVLFNHYEKFGNRFYFNFLPFPVEFVIALRINYDGNVVFCGDMMRLNLEKYIIGHISEGYKAIKQKLFTSKKVEEYYRNYFENYLK